MIKKLFKKSRKKVTEYISTNRLFLSFVILILVQTIFIRYVTLGNIWDFHPLFMDFALILLIGAIGYLFKPKRQFAYFFTCLSLITAMIVINSIYYTFYQTFTSFGLIASLSQVGGVADSLVEKLELLDFIYLLAPMLFFYIHKTLSRSNYYNYVLKCEKGKKMFASTGLVSVIIIAFLMVGLSGTDYSRLSKQWNRDFIVERFGIVMYQGNDLLQSLSLKVNSLFGYDNAAREYREFYATLEQNHSPNKYTDILKDKNIIFIHMEGIQTFLLDLEFNSIEVTPTINKLAREGMYFSNFYPQIGTGTSSDTEFTLLTSLMPALSGTVFMSYYDREYLTIPKILKEEDYYTFSMHGNRAAMWGRDKMHPNLGYDKFYSSTSFNTTEENKLGLGISDEAFFEQAMPYLIDIDNSYEKYMGTIITLSNHSPFDQLEKYGEFDLSYSTTRYNEKTAQYEPIVDPYLEDTKLGNYLKSSHYADKALGEFIDYLKASDNFNNTIFVFYGDHDAKLSRSEYEFYLNYDLETGTLLTNQDDEFIEYDTYKYDLEQKKTPLIIWTKDSSILNRLNSNIDYYMGMYDILPTIGNMMGFSSDYALGHDIFDIKDENIVIFPSGNFISKYVYYNNSTDTYIPFPGISISTDYIADGIQYTSDRLLVSNNIIVYDLIKKERSNTYYSEIEVGG